VSYGRLRFAAELIDLPYGSQLYFSESVG